MWRSAVQLCLGLRVNEMKENLSLLEGGLAQLARAPALQAGGQRFESVILHNKLESGAIREEDSKIFDMLDNQKE